jgi:ABC-type multidrug transport system fused ATPase/permease subunit
MTLPADCPQETPTSEARWEEKLEEHSPGQDTVNLIGVDVKRIADFCDVNSDIPRSVVKLMLSLVLLSSLLGWYPLLAGFGAILVFTPINYLFSKREASIQTALMRARESKTAAILQVLRGIRQIKFTALESAWEVTIEALRERELTLIWASYMNNILLTGCWIATPILLAAVSLSTYAIVHEEFSPSVAFVSLAVFESLEVTLSAIPGVMTAMLDAWVSVLRIDDYLQRPERLSELVRESDQVVLDNVSVPRSNGIQEPLNGSPGLLFKSLSLAFPAGELSIISGPTGVGKSMLLKAILGEVRVRDGRIKLPELPMKTGTWITPGAIAYVAQTPWLENTTIKNNILFGLPYHHVRYLQTIQACALESDLQVLTDGDETQVGAGGSILSGGQRWRVTLARAMYSRAELLVMDDIFSALDPHVGWHILQHCLTGELGAGRTRIVATHHSELCSPKARLLVELKADGTYVESLFSGPSEEKRIDLVAHQIEFGVLHNAETPCHLDNDKSAYVRSQTRTSAQQELTETGAVKWKVYLTFVKASGGLTFWIGAVVLFVAVQLVVVFRSWWVKLWTATSQSVSGHNLLSGMIYQQGYPLPSGFHAASSQPHNDSSTFSTTTYLSVYIALAISTSVFGVIKQYYVLTGSIKASRRLFATINSVILHAPLQWLEDVPLGRILNRMTSDFSGLETGMPYAIIYLATALLNLFSIVGVSISASPVIICFIFICLATCVWFTSVYLSVARPLKRLESATRSPIFDQFNSALTGVVTIRSFGQSASYVALMDDKLDDLTVTSWYLLLFKGWISLRIGSVGSVFASLVAAIILLMPGIDASLAGFIMAATLELSGYIMAIIQRYANMELEMNAAERIVEYCDIPTENPGGQLPPAAWPMNGLVEVEDLVVGYSDLKPVLDGITFSIQPGERLGVVGRTGAGKSTLALALLRLVEATRGSIRIDGLDISKLTLQSLRSRVAIIPQDPVLFTGTVRSNLDPFNSHDDYELKNALDQISLAPDLQGASPSDAHNYKQQWFHLSSPIFEGGVNLSQGQRQLLCLARLIIMPSKVIIMDEATSAIDMETDEVMQRSIRESFTNSTLIVIAHRLSTVADFDKILVLDEGRVVEFGTPRELWERGVHHGKFRGMCERSGERDHLEQVIYNGGAM